MTSAVVQNQFQTLAFTDLGEKYQIKHEIGRSQASSLYQAVERASGKPVALKIFRRKFSADPRFALKFRNHLREVIKLDHENLVSVLDYGMADGIYYIASEWVGGQDLSAYLSKSGSLGEQQATAIASQVCQALEFVHQHGLLHRNLKPENILLTQKGKIKLSDVGLSGLISESGLSRTHVMQGRYHYIAPEQVNGQEPSPESDIYSLGVIYYEMLTGQYPFDSRDIWDVLRMHVEADPPTIDQNLYKVSDTLVKIIQQALQKSPEMRFKSASAMNTALTSVFGEGVPAVADTDSLAGTGVWHDLRQFARRAGKFLQRPAPFRVLGKSIPFVWILLFQFAVTFLLSFLFLNTVITLNSRYQNNRSLVQATMAPPDAFPSLQKSLLKTGLRKDITRP